MDIAIPGSLYTANSQCIVVVVFNIVNNMTDYTDFAVEKSDKNVTSAEQTTVLFKTYLLLLIL